MVAPPSTADPNYVDGSGLSAYDRSLSAHADAQRTLQDMVAARHQRHAQADKIRAEKSASIVRAMSRAVRAQARKLSGTGPSTGASTGAESSQNTSRLGKVSAGGGVRRGRWPLRTWLKGVTAESSFCRDKRVRCAPDVGSAVGPEIDENAACGWDRQPWITCEPRGFTPVGVKPQTPQ